MCKTAAGGLPWLVHAFFTLGYQHQTDKEGFQVLRLVRKPNPDYKEGGLGNNNYKYSQSLYTKPPLGLPDFAHPTDQPGLFAIGFTDCLYIIYTNRSEETDLSVYHPLEIPNHPVTILAFDEPYAFLITTALSPIRTVLYLKAIGAKAGLQSCCRRIMSLKKQVGNK